MSTCRSLVMDDLDRLIEIESRCFSTSTSKTQYSQMLVNPRGFNLGVVAGSLVGFALFSTILDEAELLQIAVDPNSQRQGFSYALLQEAFVQLNSVGIDRVMLEVRASNESAIALYTKLGFTEDGRRKSYYPAKLPGAEREDAVLMSCDIQREKIS